MCNRHSALRPTQPPDTADEANQASTATLKMISHKISRELVEATQKEFSSKATNAGYEEGERGVTGKEYRTIQWAW